MKKLTVVLLVLTLLLSGCGGSKKPVETEPTTEPTTAPTQAPTIAPTQAPTIAPTEAPKEMYRHPLTGELLEEPWSGQLVAVMVNNIKASMPQHGLSQADIIYEIEEESSITRNMAIYSDVSKVSTIGSIRSTRTYFVSVARAYDAYLAHCGTSVHAANGGYDASGAKLSNWKDFDQAYNPNYYYRDSVRYQNNYAWEHTLFTTGEKVSAFLADKTQSHPAQVFAFKEGVELPGGETANEITIKFKGSKTTKFTYDPETGRYDRSQHGSVSIDASTNEVESVKNVIALYTKQWYCPQGHGHQYYDTIGSGEGYAAVNGKIVKINWSRASVDEPFVYTLADGSPLELDVGNSYIAIVGIKYDIAYQ